jgi:PKD repeat protein
MVAFLVVSSTGFVLAQKPVPAKELSLTGDGSEYVEMDAAAATDQLQICEVTVPGINCGGGDQYLGNIVAFDFSNFPYLAWPEDDGNHCELIKDLQASGYNVRKFDLTPWDGATSPPPGFTESSPWIGPCVDAVVITSLSQNTCPLPAYTPEEAAYIQTRVDEGVGLLLLNEWGMEGGGCGGGTAPIADAFGAIWNENGGGTGGGGTGTGPIIFAAPTHYSQDSPAALFSDVPFWEGYAISDYTTPTVGWDVEWNVVTYVDGPPVMVAKQHGEGCAVIVGDTNWATDYVPLTGPPAFIDRSNNRQLANNAFSYLSNCGLWADPNGPYFGSAGSEIQFDGSGSQDHRGEPITSYAWDFDDTYTGTGPNPTHTYDTAGTYAVCLTVSTDSGRSDRNCTTAYINGTNQPPVANPNGPYSGSEGSAVTFDGSGSSDPDGGALTYNWDFGDSNTGTGASPSHTYADDGIYNVCLTVTDPGGLSDSDCTSADIANVAPAVGPIAVDLTLVEAGTTVNASADFTDPGILDSHTAEWDWGDVTMAGTVSQGAGSGSVADSHIYETAGIYTIQLTVTDNDAGSGESFFEHVVVYDRGEGFVTGSGKFDWPPDGASAAGAGDTQFSVVAKYLKGDAVPTGGTSFVLQGGGPGGLEFVSASYEWLVITDGNHATLKGTGTITGEEGVYEFEILAGDGTLDGADSFAIRIWRTVGGSEEVRFNSDVQPITNGNIVIHDNVKD